MIVGVMAILVVILAPKGLIGLWREWFAHFEVRDSEVPAQTKLPTELMSEP